MADPIRRRFERYVAIGDSSTEGLEDPDGNGGYRGWADRLAQRLADHQGGLLYANLAVRGRRTRQILEQQLEPALALGPDLVTLFSGTNGVVRRRFDPAGVARGVVTMQSALTAAGVVVVGFTLPDLGPVMPLGRLVSGRVRELNEALRHAAATTGALLVDFAAHPVASDPRLWNEDRLHANALGHARIAAALAHALGLPGTDGSWASPLPPLPTPSWTQRLDRELRWLRLHLLPWLARHLAGRSLGDGRSAKRPSLLPLGPGAGPPG